MESDLGKLFIGGISWDTDEERLKDYFGKYGEVVEAMIMRDRVTGRARGFGFVVFSDPAVAESVIIDKHMIDGRTVEAKKAVPRDDQNILNRNVGDGITGSPAPGRTKKIFVGGLASTVTESDFKGYFDQFGTITDVVVMYDHVTQRPRGFGFITYDSEEAVDTVLHKTFHELNGKLVEVKRAVPKELSPGPTRSPVLGYNYGLNRAASVLNNYGLNRAASVLNNYGLNRAASVLNNYALGGFGVRMDGRFNPLTSGRTGFPPFSPTSYGIGMNMEPAMSPSYGIGMNMEPAMSPSYGIGMNMEQAMSPSYGIGMNMEPAMSPSYGGGSNFGNSLGMISPYYSGNSNRYNTPIGYGVGSGRNYSSLTSPTRNVWGNGSLTNATNGSFGSLGNTGANWSPSPAMQSGGNSGYMSSYDNYVLGRNSGSVAAPTSPFAGTTDGDLYRSGSVYGDATWQSATPDLDGSGAFGYGIGDISEDYVGSYSVASRHTNRGIAA